MHRFELYAAGSRELRRPWVIEEAEDATVDAFVRAVAGALGEQAADVWVVSPTDELVDELLLGSKQARDRGLRLRDLSLRAGAPLFVAAKSEAGLTVRARLAVVAIDGRTGVFRIEAPAPTRAATDSAWSPSPESIVELNGVLDLLDATPARDASDERFVRLIRIVLRIVRELPGAALVSRWEDALDCDFEDVFEHLAARLEDDAAMQAGLRDLLVALSGELDALNLSLHPDIFVATFVAAGRWDAAARVAGRNFFALTRLAELQHQAGRIDDAHATAERLATLAAGSVLERDAEELLEAVELPEDRMDDLLFREADRLRLWSATVSRTLKLARNAPCPCASGRKFKQCHGA